MEDVKRVTLPALTVNKVLIILGKLPHDQSRGIIDEITSSVVAVPEIPETPED